MPETLVLLARIGLGAVFVAAGAAKLIDRAEFEKHLPAFGVKWPSVARAMSYVLPLAEVVIGTLLIVGLIANVAASAALVLLALFTLVVTVALVRRTPVSCGCFGNIGRGKLTLMTLGRNVGLVFVDISVISTPTSTVTYAPWVMSLILGTTITLGVMLAGQFLSLRSSFLAMPLAPHQSGIRWSYVDPSVRFRLRGITGRQLERWTSG